MKTKLALFFAVTLFRGAFEALGQPEPGSLLWSYDVGYALLSSPALASDGTVYVGGSLGLSAITNNSATASNRWTFSPGERVHGSATVGSDGTIYFGSGNANFYAVNPDGSQKWKLPLQPEYQTKVEYESTPSIGPDGTIYFVASGRLYAVTPGGVIKWEHVIDHGSTVRNLSAAIGADGTIYVGGYFNNTLYALNADGSEKWSFPLGTAQSPAIGADGTIYITLGRLRALALGGALDWENSLEANAPAVVSREGTIYVANSDLALCSVKPNGQINWQVARYSIPTVPTTPAIDASGMVYYCVSNALFAVTPQGTIQSVFKSGYPVSYYVTSTSPAIGPDGTIYAAFGTKLFALAGTNGLADAPWPMYHQNARHTGKVGKPSLKHPQRRSDGGFQFELYG